MAFNFNWSPLTADASFYTRAQELLTTALNKSPKPPIIVDDILVNELNLGSVPPDLEILEIGDLAEDRFRGIFKMVYTGDAFLTLKTRVQVCWMERRDMFDIVANLRQANPLNTYLSTKPSFTSPQPLAASSSLTIPLQITLSEIKLSAFIILVFSKQKGLTLVFRNDPLESLKVSSTFDSIPFVREYLQTEIEGQLRTLLMDEVPAIIHRLSLRLWVPEYRAKEDEELARKDQKSVPEEKAVDPLASPPQDPVDFSGKPLDANQIASISLDAGSEAHSLFSQKNLLRLAALTDSHRTLSLFTPSIRDAVFRAWAGPTERGEHFRSTPSITPALSRSHSHIGSISTTYVFPEGSDGPSHTARPSLTSFGSAATGLGLGSNKHGKAHGGRKRNHRVVNLRKKKGSNSDDMESVSGEGSTMSETLSETVSSAPSGFASEPARQREDELVTPPKSPEKLRLQADADGIDLRDTPPRLRNFTPRPPESHWDDTTTTPRPSIPLTFTDSSSSVPSLPNRPPLHRPTYSFQYPPEKPALSSSSHSFSPQLPSPFPYLESASGGILEQAWVMKMAGEIARRVQDEKAGAGVGWQKREEEREEAPPPAYGA